MKKREFTWKIAVIAYLLIVLMSALNVLLIVMTYKHLKAFPDSEILKGVFISEPTKEEQ